MPQLNPSPWFFMFMTLWLITLMLKPIMTSLTHIDPPKPHQPHHQPNSWTWTWQ
uniref:ATP synthase complex subunit 8 n=1 Tax=Gehyra marginata TaxID=1074251 RepID=A0A7R7G347_9SAUR|nr:ATPase subunit 8 [Gehyra marginata]